MHTYILIIEGQKMISCGNALCNRGFSLLLKSSESSSNSCGGGGGGGCSRSQNLVARTPSSCRMIGPRPYWLPLPYSWLLPLLRANIIRVARGASRTRYHLRVLSSACRARTRAGEHSCEKFKYVLGRSRVDGRCLNIQSYSPRALCARSSTSLSKGWET